MVYFLFLFYLAAIYIRPGEILLSFQNVPVVLILSGAGMLAMAADLAMRPRRVFTAPADKYLFGVWAAVTLSNLSWGWIDGATMAFNQFAVVAMLYIFCRVAITTPARVRGVIRLLIVLNAFQALNGIVQFHTGIGLGGVEAFTGGRIRGTGIFNDPNDLAFTLMMPVPFLLTSTSSHSKIIGRAIALVFLSIIVAAIFYTNSRGAVLGLVALLIARWGSVYGRFTGFVGGAVVFVGLVTMGPSRAQEIDPSEASAQGRIKAWHSGLEMLKGDPLFGVGYSRFGDFHERVAHNSFVHIMGETGFLGAVCFVGMIYWTLSGLSTSRFRAPPVAGAPPAALRGATPPQRETTTPNQPPGAASLRTMGRDLYLSAIGMLVCAMFLSRQYNVILYLLFTLAATITTMASSAPAKPEANSMKLGRVSAICVAMIVGLEVVVRVWGAF